MQDSSTGNYTPTTDDVRDDYVYDDHLHPGARAAFDRWYKAELVKARAEALREAATELEGMGVEPWNRLDPAIQALRFRANRIEEGR